MKTCGALLVLLCCCLTETQLRGETISENDITHQGHYGEGQRGDGSAHRTEAAAAASTQQTCQPDIHTVLREMNALLAEQRVELRYTKTQMEAMETRLRASEKTVEEQRVELRYTKTQMEAMETRLRASEKTVEEQRVVIKELKEKLEEQTVAVKVVEDSVNLTGSQVEELRREREERMVSFSASLLPSGSGQTGPFTTETPLVYRHVFTNIGNHYNPNTGVFTAPVRGIYHFVIFVHATGHPSRPGGVSLHKNEQLVVMAYEHHSDHNMNPSNGASLLLEVGDVVYAKLRPTAWVYDSQNHHTTFSGHLLFPMSKVNPEIFTGGKPC